MTYAPRMIWPVYGFEEGRFAKKRTVAHFFQWADAVDFIHHPERYGAERCHLYTGEPKYDRREDGYHG